MGMPAEFVLVRHGESEANVMQHLLRDGFTHPQVEAIYNRPDWQQRLSLRGIEQARAAGRWIDRELGGVESFDLRIRSPFYRTRETSLYLTDPELLEEDAEITFHGKDTTWQVDDRLVERHWGTFGTLTPQEQKLVYPRTVDLKKRDPWYTALDGGESPAGGVRTRIRDLHGTFHRDYDGKRVIAVTHGEFMWTERQVQEGLLPEEWMDLDGDEQQRIRNCAVLQYNRTDPNDPEHMAPNARWMRFVYPDALDESPFGGEWVEIQRKRQYTAAQTLGQIAMAPRLLDNLAAAYPLEQPASSSRLSKALKMSGSLLRRL